MQLRSGTNIQGFKARALQGVARRTGEHPVDGQGSNDFGSATVTRVTKSEVRNVDGLVEHARKPVTIGTRMWPGEHPGDAGTSDMVSPRSLPRANTMEGVIATRVGRTDKGQVGGARDLINLGDRDMAGDDVSSSVAADDDRYAYVARGVLG
jgi:hypothetical protein